MEYYRSEETTLFGFVYPFFLGVVTLFWYSLFTVKGITDFPDSLFSYSHLGPGTGVTVTEIIITK